MYQRRSFLEYVHKQDGTFLEMARLKEEDAIQFDEFDFKYLKHFQPATQNIWMNAIMKRYSPMILNHPEQEKHDITIETQIEENGKKTQKRYVFQQVPTFTKQLIAKLEGRYDISKINLNNNQGRGAARKAALRALEHLADNAKPMPALHLNNALLDSKKMDRREKTADQLQTANLKYDPTVREPIELDDDDKKFLAWFDAHPDYPKLKAFQLRYRDDDNGLVNDPQAQKSLYKDAEPGALYRMHFKGLPPAEMVPVNATRLRKRLDDLRNKGIDLGAIPLSNSTAKEWIAKGVWKPYLGQKGTRDRDVSLGSKKMTSIQDYIQAQDEYLKGEEAESPNVPGGVSDDFQQDVPWMKLLRHETRLAAKKAMQRQESQEPGTYRKIQKFFNVDDLAAELLAYMAKEDIVANADYRSQKWRIDKAFRRGTEVIKDYWNEFEKKGERNTDPDWEGKKKKGEEDVPGAIDTPTRTSTDNAIIDLLKATPEAQSLSQDTNWDHMAQQFIKAVNKWQDDNRFSQINPTITRMIAKDVVTPYIPSMAAEKQPLSVTPKISKAVVQNYTANPDSGASFGGRDDDDAADDVSAYRRRRF